MSLFFNIDDGMHIDRLNAEQMRKRGAFVHVKPFEARDDYGRKQSENQAASIVYPRNNLSFSGAELKRESFMRTPPRKVRGNKILYGKIGGRTHIMSHSMTLT